jgi:hypothetical protein
VRFILGEGSCLVDPNGGCGVRPVGPTGDGHCGIDPNGGPCSG